VQRNGSAAWVTDAYPTPLGKRHDYNLNYVVDKRRESFGIPIGGMKPMTLEPAGRKRRGSEGPVGSSLLSSISVSSLSRDCSHQSSRAAQVPYGQSAGHLLDGV
jgi:hypothetical protein